MFKIKSRIIGFLFAFIQKSHTCINYIHISLFLQPVSCSTFATFWNIYYLFPYFLTISKHNFLDSDIYDFSITDTCKCLFLSLFLICLNIFFVAFLQHFLIFLYSFSKISLLSFLRMQTFIYPLKFF